MIQSDHSGATQVKAKAYKNIGDHHHRESQAYQTELIHPYGGNQQRHGNNGDKDIGRLNQAKKNKVLKGAVFPKLKQLYT